jgi:hypothetical protein
MGSDAKVQSHAALWRRSGRSEVAKAAGLLPRMLTDILRRKTRFVDYDTAQRLQLAAATELGVAVPILELMVPPLATHPFFEPLPPFRLRALRQYHEARRKALGGALANWAKDASKAEPDVPEKGGAIWKHGVKETLRKAARRLRRTERADET